MDYDTLVADKSTAGSVKSWTGYDKGVATDWLTDAEAWIYSKLRVREMQASASVSIAAGASTAALPTGWLDPLLLKIRVPSLELKNYMPADLERQRVYEDDGVTLAEGIPTCVAVFNELFQFDFMADDDYVATAIFYKQPTALGSGNPTNWLTTRYPALLRSVLIAMAAKYMLDTELMTENLTIGTGLISDANIESDLQFRNVIR